MYPNYKKMKSFLKIDKIKNDFLKKQLQRIVAEETIFNQYEKRIDPKLIEIIDLIILKEIQYKEKTNFNKKQENHLKKEKDMEIISDRILGNITNMKTNKEESLKDIEKLGKYLKEEIDIEKGLEINKDNYIEENEKNMDNINSNLYILSALSSLLNNEGITTIIEKKVKIKNFKRNITINFIWTNHS